MKTIGAVIIVLIILIAGGAYFGYTYYENSHNTGHMAISVADAPMPGVSGVYITFSAVGIHSNTSGWVNYSVSTHTVDILNLTATNAKWETFLSNMFISNPVGWLLDDVFSVFQPSP